MIISDSHKLAFVHIPKCAGSTVRSRLRELDDRKGFYTNRIEWHPELGWLDYVHIPLFTLRDHFETDFQKLRDYWTFAAVRDPYSRFPSSISQRLKKHGRQPMHNLTVREVKKEVDIVIDYLSKMPRANTRLTPAYIHFQKQVDYIFIDGVRIIDAIYMADEVNNLIAGVSQHIGEGCNIMPSEPIESKNRTMGYRNEFLRQMFSSTRIITRQASKALPKIARDRVRSLMFVERDRRFDDIFASKYVKEFVQYYYMEDIGFVNRIRSGSHLAD